MHIVNVKSDIVTINGPVLLGTNVVHLSGVHCKITRIMVTIKKRAGVISYSFSSSIALLSSLLSCSFYLLDPRTISRVDILEMTRKDGKAYRRLTTMCVVNKLL